MVWNIFYFSTIYGIILPIDQYFSEGLKPPTRYILPSFQYWHPPTSITDMYFSGGTTQKRLSKTNVFHRIFHGDTWHFATFSYHRAIELCPRDGKQPACGFTEWKNFIFMLKLTEKKTQLNWSTPGFSRFSPHFSLQSSDKIIENPSVVMCTALGDQTWFAGNFPIYYSSICDEFPNYYCYFLKCISLDFLWPCSITREEIQIPSTPL